MEADVVMDDLTAAKLRRDIHRARGNIEMDTERLLAFLQFFLEDDVLGDDDRRLLGGAGRILQEATQLVRETALLDGLLEMQGYIDEGE